MGLRIAFVAGLSDNKLIQKIEPLEYINNITSIDLYRRFCLNYKFVNWIPIPNLIQKSAVLSELYRFANLVLSGGKYDLFIGCNQSYHGLWAYVVGLIYHKPVIQIVTTDVNFVLKNPMLKKVLLSANSCGVRGEISVHKLREGGYKGHIEIIANVYPFIEKPEQSEKEYDIIFVTHSMHKDKDIPWLLNVLSEVKKKYPNFKIAIVGRGIEEKYNKEVKSLNIQNNIIFLGFINSNDLKKEYLKSKMMVLTSKVEGLPMVIIEAMSFSLPMVVTDAGDIPSVVRNGIEGYIVKNGMTTEMVDSISSLLSDPKKLKIFGENSRKHYDEMIAKFQPAEIGKSWQRLIEVT